MPASKSFDLQIGRSAIKISLLRVVPGKEGLVANSLQAAIRRQTGKEPLRILKTFGNYDIAAIYEGEDFMPSVGQSGSIASGAKAGWDWQREFSLLEPSPTKWKIIYCWDSRFRGRVNIFIVHWSASSKLLKRHTPFGINGQP
jgi:hypothetical protein